MAIIQDNLYEAMLRFGKSADTSEETASHFEPTDHLPGSLEKIEVMRHRASLGHPVFHPQDRPDWGLIGTIKNNFLEKRPRK